MPLFTKLLENGFNRPMISKFEVEVKLYPEDKRTAKQTKPKEGQRMAPHEVLHCQRNG
jgi:hypothetical protein